MSTISPPSSAPPKADERGADPVRLQRVRTVLFDLDGTLADTAPDIAFALNTVLAEEGRAPLPAAELKPLISRGAAAMVAHGFNGVSAAAEPERILQRLLKVYRAHIADHTRLFEGMEAVLRELDARDVRWGVVTNKQRWLTEPLLDALALTSRAACIVSGDTTPKQKPHPEPLLAACERTGSRPEECVYIGDALRDIEAGRRAGMGTLVALYGYLAEGDDPATWGANGLLACPEDVIGWLDRNGAEGLSGGGQLQT